jgi:sarcosine oxidase, subunit gamma
MGILPENMIRRSFLYRELVRLGARFESVEGMAAAVDFGDPEGELAAARRLGIADCGALARTGYKGPNSLRWLQGQGVVVGDGDNMAYPQLDGSLAARLAPTEALILGTPAGGAGLCGRLDASWSIARDLGVYRVPRADTNCWLRIAGALSPAMFAKLCGVDLRPQRFAEGAIAQTQLANLSAIIVRSDLAGVSAYHLLTDSASALHVWTSLMDAFHEFGGAPVGLTALRRLADA